MKRDMDLIRKLMAELEKVTGDPDEGAIEIDGYTDLQIDYHSYLLIDAGLALGVEMEADGEELSAGRLFHLTWKGHEFLDAARDDSIWNHVKKTVKEKGLSMSYALAKTLLLKAAKDKFGISIPNP